MNKEQPIKGKEEILDSHYESRMHWQTVNRANVLKAMEEYKNQFIQSGEERLFTLKEMIDCWESSTIYTYSKNQYFKEKFNIDL